MNWVKKIKGLVIILVLLLIVSVSWGATRLIIRNSYSSINVVIDKEVKDNNMDMGSSEEVYSEDEIMIKSNEEMKEMIKYADSLIED